MKKDVQNLLAHFNTRPRNLKKGDLLITAEVHRVIAPSFCGRRDEIEVSTVWPAHCAVCKNCECIHLRVMAVRGGGQQAGMVFLGKACK